MRISSPAWLRSTGRFVIRHRYSIQDLTLAAAAALVVGYLAFEFDIFVTLSHRTAHQQQIELDEMLLVGAVLTVGLLLFSWRRLREAKAETRRRTLAEVQARELAFQDPLTGLPNRRQFNDAMKAAVDAPPAASASHALLMLDLNGFKQINDVYGHNAGDEALVLVAHRLLAATRDGEMVARLGGDEFAIVALHLSGAEAATGIALRIIESLDQPFTIGGNRSQIGAGVGICLFPFAGDSVEEVMRRADIALYRAKAERKSALRFFDPAMDRHVRERESMERDLRDALARGEIVPRFQPLVDLHTKEVVGLETKPWWDRPGFGAVPRERFIPLAEDCGLLPELTDQILRSACATARHWPAHVTLSFAVSPAQLKDPGLGLRLLAILGAAGLPAERLEIEITEAALVRDFEAAQLALGPLRASGVRIALGEFGTGYSSLYHLRNFKLDNIKIDRGFIRAMQSERESAAIVSALVGLGHGLGLTITADGVDDANQEAALLATGCQQGQGNFFGEAISSAETAALFPQAPASAAG